MEILNSSVHIVRIGLKQIVRGFFNVGKTLLELQNNELYKLEGFKNFYDFTFSAFQLSKSHTIRLVNIYKRFPIDGYDKFSFSQLTEMLSLPDYKLASIRPEMTVKQIREIKKESKNSDVGTKKDKDKIIKKKDKIEFGEQVNIVDVVSNDFKELVNVSEEVEGLEAANKVLKNRKESLELKIDNYKKSNKEKDELIKQLNEQIEKHQFSYRRERKRDNDKINNLKNENSNLLSQLADLQKLVKEKDIKIDTLEKVIELQEKQIKEYIEEKKSKRTRDKNKPKDLPS